MSWWSRLLTGLRSYGGFYGPYGLQDKALQSLFGGAPVSSGVQVNEQKALTTSAVWACVQLIAGTLGSLPLIHYRKLANGGKERFTESRLYRLLHDTPNDEMSANTFFETLTQHVLLWGNAFAEIRRDARGQVAALYIIEPWRVTAERDGAGVLRYVVDGSTKLAPEEMLHVPGLTPDGVWGYSVIQKARESVGLLLAQERFGGTAYSNGLSVGGILTHPGRLSEKAETTLRESLEKRAQGVDRAHNFIVLQEGMTYAQTNIPPNDAEYLDSRKFQLNEICRWFGVPPHMVGDVERSTSWGTGIEQQNIGFVTYTLRRWLGRFEKEVMRKLISPLEYNFQMVEFVLDALLRGDTASRKDYFAAGKNGGWLSTNDIRRLENMDPIGPDGDVYLVPGNMVPADRLDDVIDAQTAPKPPPAPPAPAGETAGARRLDQIMEELETLMTLGRESLARAEHPMLPLADPEVVGDLAALREAVAAIVPTVTAALPPPAAPADLTPVLARLDSVEHERQAQDERMAAMLPDVQVLIEEAARDFVRREGDRAARAAGSPEKLSAWMDEFYPRQADYGVKKLLGSMRVYTQLVGRADEAEADIRSCLDVYLAESRRALSGLLGLPPEEIKMAVAQLMTRWETDRPAELARALMGGRVAPRALEPIIIVREPVAPPEPETRVVEKEITERDVTGRAQKSREIQQQGGEILVVEKEVTERDALGRATKIREVHTRKRE